MWAGALVGIGVGLYVTRERDGWPVIARIMGAVLGSMAGAALPDLVEPGVHSWHRRSLHSWSVLAGSGVATVAPPAFLRQWITEREAAANRWRAAYEALPIGHPDRAGLCLAEFVEHFLIGAAVGLPAGYASHLVLDATSPRGLPPI